ncbi:MAG: NAD(P)H-dependent oxidoreductase [Candidatus Pacebacteria bacterium]|nr:NAD(P)H-dependent oxidoreductase [Candidatus Paceibacterota bacterium]
MEPFKVLVLNASLKRGDSPSNTEEVAMMVIDEMKKYADISYEIVRLSDKKIPVGLGFRESDDDEWPGIVDQMKRAHIVLFATPVWWGGRSSLMQRAIERMDAFDEEANTGGRSALLNKVAGVVITGSEDGAQATLAGLLSTLTFLNFTIPPQACTYWVGEVGEDPKSDAERRRKNTSVSHMAANTARNLVTVAKMLRISPLSAT